MATVLVDLERWAVQNPRGFLAGSNYQDSLLDGNRRVRLSWNFSYIAHGFTLGATRLKQHKLCRRRIIIRAKKERRGDGGSKESRGPDLRFDSMEMMELEFGRLLGEDRQTTLAKVVGKKRNPELTYVKIEKEKELQQRRELARRSSPSKIPAAVRPDFTLEGKASDYTTQPFEPGVPDLISPPVRPPGFEKVEASPMRTIRVAPMVRSGGRKKSVDADPYELDGLVPKPLRVAESEKGLPPVRPAKSVIAPVLMKRKENASVDIQPKTEDSLLRRPSVRVNALGEPLISDQIPPSTSIEEVQSAVDIGPVEMSEERFRQLLDGELSLGRQGVRKTISRASVSKKVSPALRPVLPSLEEKPSTFEKSRLVESTKNVSSEPAYSTSSAGAEGGPGLQDAAVSSPQPIMSSRPKAKLSKHSLVRQKANPEVTVVNDVPSDVNEENVSEDVKADDVISLEESTLKIRVAEETPDNISDSGDDRRGLTNSLPVVRLEGEDTSVGNVDVQGYSEKKSSSAAIAIKPVMRLRKTSLHLQQPALSKDDGYPVDSTSEGTSSSQDTHVGGEEPAPNCASENVGEQGIKEAQQSVELETTLPKTRQPVPGLKLSRPASPPAFTSKKDAQVDTALSTLQKAISSFDERRNIPNKKENDEDWARAEALRDSKAIEELEIIGTGRGGLLVGFGSLVGYLPAFELKAERRPVSFTVWAQSKGYDAKTRKYFHDKDNQSSGWFTTTSMESTTSGVAQDTGGIVDALDQRSPNTVNPELLEHFKKERAAAVSLLVGQRAKVMVISVDKSLRQLRVSEKQAEGEGQELSQKKIVLMESLNVGDVVTCQVKKITAFGAFVDLQGVPALIHSSELSWNRNTDPLSVLQVGQVVEAKVCKLDRFLQRINLSLKLMQPDPLLETLESLVSPDADMASASADVQMEDSEELNRFIWKLEQIPEIAAVRSGRRVRGAALAPAFQIYLSGPLDNGYKLLARFRNEVQEVLVETSADRERMKDFIRDCTVQE